MKDVDLKYNDALLLSKKPREPLLNVPFIIIVLISFCFLIYLIPQYFFSNQLYSKSFMLFSFIPALFKVEPLVFCYTVISYSFMHGDFEHIAINMIWLLAFGSPLVKRFGNLCFLLFWMLTAVISALTYFAFHQDSTVPLVGASGAISGMMGAAARYGFSSAPFDSNMQSGRFLGSLWSIREALSSRTVLVYIGVWLMVNFITGIFPSLSGRDDISIAWEAHIGGLISGFLLIGIFDFLWRNSKITI
ncbi:rhomboid family intramembrane serine protease [Bartonella sp. A05]|uniref:rhomboid family intramembrane serine protease n=1 Tax=Bartonella sp. A05 TaxID=2967261 RepID=UPI0022A9001B|nr:rhomboid family intramembrane serine protease [Bartonella sp. A05]MCZ2203739.1 rhomboid family intramembrane serine protease [Bartonella sp. A05]